MKNYRSTLGGALAALGTFMFAAPMVFTSTQYECPRQVIIWCMIIGFFLQGFGQFFNGLFSADARTVTDLKQQVLENRTAIRTGNTSMLRKDDGAKE